MLAHAPVNFSFAACHGTTVVQHAVNQGMHREVLGNGCQLFTNASQLGQWQGGISLVSPFGTQESGPISGVLVLVVSQNRFNRALAVFHQLTVTLDQVFRLVLGQNALSHQLVGVQFARTVVLTNFLVHQRLGHRGSILLVVAQFTEADDINHDVVFELAAEIQSQLSHEYDGFGIVAVHVEHRGFNHLDHVRAIQRRTRIAGVRGGETDLVIDDDVQRTTGTVATSLGQVQCFHHHALTGKCRVTMHQHRQNLAAVFVATTILASTNRTLNHRIHNFQVGWVKGQGQVNRTATGGQVAGKTVVVFHVTVGQAFSVMAFKLSEQISRHLAHDVDQHVQTTTVGHTHDDFLNTVLAGMVDHFIHTRDEAFATFQRESFLTYVFGVQEAFQAFGLGQLLQDVALLLNIERTGTGL